MSANNLALNLLLSICLVTVCTIGVATVSSVALRQFERGRVVERERLALQILQVDAILEQAKSLACYELNPDWQRLKLPVVDLP